MLTDWITHEPITRRDIRKEIRIIRKRLQNKRYVRARSIYYRRLVRLAAMLKQA